MKHPSENTDSLLTKARHAIEEALKNHGFSVLLNKSDDHFFYSAVVWEEDNGGDVEVFLDKEGFQIIGRFAGKKICHEEAFKIVEFTDESVLFVQRDQAQTSNKIVERSLEAFQKAVERLHEENLRTVKSIEAWESEI